MTTYHLTTDPHERHLLAPQHIGQVCFIPVHRIGGSVWAVKCVPGTVVKTDGWTSEISYVLPNGYEPA